MFKKVLVLYIAIIAAAGLRASAQQGPNGMGKRPVTVKGAEGRQITCPAPMVDDATSPLGVTTTFASGSVFRIGTPTLNSASWTPPVTGPSPRQRGVIKNATWRGGTSRV